MNTTTPVQIRIDKEIREKANALFKELGTDMSGAVNMFLRQCVYTDSIPLELKRPRGNAETSRDGAREGVAKGERDRGDSQLVDPMAERYASFGEYQEIMRRLEQGK